MSVKFIILVVFVALGIMVYGFIAQGMDIISQPVSGSSTMDPDIDTILSYAQAWQTSPLGQLVNVPAHMRYFEALLSITVHRQSLKAAIPEDSPWLWSWVILWTPIIAGFVFGIIALFIGIISRYISD